MHVHSVIQAIFISDSQMLALQTESGKQNMNSPSRQGDSLGTSTDSLDIIHVLKYSQRDYNRMKKEMELDYQVCSDNYVKCHDENLINCMY